jgi:hypothetical protein
MMEMRGGGGNGQSKGTEKKFLGRENSFHKVMAKVQTKTKKIPFSPEKWTGQIVNGLTD